MDHNEDMNSTLRFLLGWLLVVGVGYAAVVIEWDEWSGRAVIHRVRSWRCWSQIREATAAFLRHWAGHIEQPGPSHVEPQPVYVRPPPVHVEPLPVYVEPPRHVPEPPPSWAPEEVERYHKKPPPPAPPPPPPPAPPPPDSRRKRRHTPFY